MHALLGRLLLLVLLAIDWAADPDLLAPTVRALAARLASTECYCHSLRCREEARREAIPAGSADPGPVAPPTTAPACPCPESRSPPDPGGVARAGLVYLFMSIRC
jgi:hypothetical protein